MKKFNLTAIRDLEGVRLKHFLDSLSCTLAWRGGAPTRLIDIGTGAGFPGIGLENIVPGDAVNTGRFGRQEGGILSACH